MAFLKAIRCAIRSLQSKASRPALHSQGERPAYRDTLSAIHDLSRLVRNDPEAIDIYLALGNLFRAQGDIERAVMIREGLIARPGLNTAFKARSYFELGQDYHRAGVVDRALAAFREAAKLGYSQTAVTSELADLFAHAGSFERAAEEYGKVNNYLAQAHYIVRHAEEFARSGKPDKAERLIKKALRIYPGSVEAWNALICMAALAGAWRKASSLFESGLEQITPPMQFLVLDALLDIETKAHPGVAPKDILDGALGKLQSVSFTKELCEMVVPIIERHEPHILLHYHVALLLLRAGAIDEVDVWLAKALVVQPDFWAARLQSLVLSVQKHELPPVVAMQISYLADELQHIKRFVCTICGFRENQVFYRCRRCGSWHSLAFRLTLQE